MSSGQESKENSASESQSAQKKSHRHHFYPHKANLGKILHGRHSSSKHAAAAAAAAEEEPHVQDTPLPSNPEPVIHEQEPSGTGTEPDSPVDIKPKQRPQLRRPETHDAERSIYEQVRKWLDAEREKKRRSRQRAMNEELQHLSLEDDAVDSLDTLEEILMNAVSASARPGSSRRGSYILKRQSSSRSLKNFNPAPLTGSMSDTYITDNERTILQDVPSCEVTIDNTKESSVEFKTEVLKLTHTLRIKNWRRVDLDRGAEVQIDRISGALTNAVYKMTPPHVTPVEASASNQSVDRLEHYHDGSHAQTGNSRRFRQPKPLLLRIYGPQVGHLIDRDTELSILRRLAKQKVGPTLLGTFENGRFEEFFEARTLTRKDIRQPETSRQIGRRLRDLHDHIALLQSERKSGTCLWSNWDKWVARGQGVMSVIQQREAGKRHLITNWEKLREVVEQRYRPWLFEKYGGTDEVHKQMIFAHNDTQYGNIMSKKGQPNASSDATTPRVSTMESSFITAARSPSLMPMGSPSMGPRVSPSMGGGYGQSLVVIDFEYAGANTRGAEFANHFCEWMSDYHGLLGSETYTIYNNLYPSAQEQRNCLRAYVEHRPLPYQIPSEASPSHPVVEKRKSMTFNLDKRNTDEEEAVIVREIDNLVSETRDWRGGVNANWALWGIVQANVPGVEIDEYGNAKDIKEDKVTAEDKREKELANGTGTQVGELAEEEDNFDYLKYAEQKAMIFWGDMLMLGLVKEEELREWAGGVQDIKSRIKMLAA